MTPAPRGSAMTVTQAVDRPPTRAGDASAPTGGLQRRDGSKGVTAVLNSVRPLGSMRDGMLVLAFAALCMAVVARGQHHAMAWIDVGVIALGMALLQGPRRPFDAVLRLRLSADEGLQSAFAELLKRRCRRFVLVRLREVGGDCFEHSYQLQFPEWAFRGLEATLLRDLTALQGVSDATLTMADTPVS